MREKRRGKNRNDCRRKSDHQTLSHAIPYGRGHVAALKKMIKC